MSQFAAAPEPKAKRTTTFAHGNTPSGRAEHNPPCSPASRTAPKLHAAEGCIARRPRGGDFVKREGVESRLVRNNWEPFRCLPPSHLAAPAQASGSEFIRLLSWLSDSPTSRAMDNPHCRELLTISRQFAARAPGHSAPNRPSWGKRGGLGANGSAFLGRMRRLG